MLRSLGFWIAHVNVLGICLVLLGAFGVQFGAGEMPCPLCMLQRMAMMLCALGPAYVILRARQGAVTVTDLATGYGMSVFAAVGGAAISSRQILLHILPGDPGYGAPVLGLHLYTWALVVFVVVLLDSGLNLIFCRALEPGPVTFGWPSKLVIGLFAGVIFANAVTVFLLEGFHWTLPDDPARYELFHDLGLR